MAVRFDVQKTVCDLYPIYVKNRDPRVDYQPKALSGASGKTILHRLAQMSDASGARLDISGGTGRLSVPRAVFEGTM